MEDTKQRILEKSLELFSTKGYDAVSVGEIAKAVGIKAPSLYNHFPSNQAIFGAILETTSAASWSRWPIWAPINIIGNLAVPISLSLRLFANILSGTAIMALIYTLLGKIALI